DDGGVDRAVLHAGGHARRAAADDQHRFAEARVDGVDGDEIVAVGLAAGIHRTGDEQLVADEALILPRGHDGADDLDEDHCLASGIAPPRPAFDITWPRRPCRWAVRPRDWRADAE